MKKIVPVRSFHWFACLLLLMAVPVKMPCQNTADAGNDSIRRKGAGVLFFNGRYTSWSDDSVARFVQSRPFRLAEISGKFRYGMLSAFDLHALDFASDSLQPLSLENYYSIFESQPQQTASPEDWYYFFSLQDTTNTGFCQFTILWYHNRACMELYLVTIGKSGPRLDEVKIAGYIYEARPGGAAADYLWQRTAAFTSSTKGSYSDSEYLPNPSYSPADGSSCLAFLTTGSGSVTITPGGTIRLRAKRTHRKKTNKPLQL